MGRIGLWNPKGWPGLEVGWLLARSRWGEGLATEGGRRALAWAFDMLAADHVISLIRPENVASIRVAEKLGESRDIAVGPRQSMPSVACIAFLSL